MFIGCSWTDHDVNVACRELGFASGVFNFFSWARNDSRFMLVYKPGCTGDENSLMDCPGAQHAQIGSRICGKILLIYTYFLHHLCLAHSHI